MIQAGQANTLHIIYHYVRICENAQNCYNPIDRQLTPLFGKV
ncbi:hypothetical protein [Floridanema evergladense]